MEENNSQKLLPQVPVLGEYQLVLDEVTLRISKLNQITELTKENEKEVKDGIAEINKIAKRISRYRIDNTEAFLKYIEPYIAQCKEIESVCTVGVADLKALVKKLEQEERGAKKDTLKKLFEFTSEACPYRNILKFEMFFEEGMANKSTSLTVTEKQLAEWIKAKTCDLDFINKNVDEVESVIAIYLTNGLNLALSIEEHQNRYKSESEIKAMMANDAPKVFSGNSFEKKVDVTLKILNLPQSKVKALQSFMDGLGVEWEIVK